MAISIDWLTKVITVPKADMTLIQSNPIEIRELNLNTFRLWLKDIEDSDVGMAFLDTHQHNPPVTVGGVTLARVVEIINGYTITFENGAYAVNLVGANSNVGDVLNLNTVQVRSANSAGLIQTSTLTQQNVRDAMKLAPTAGAPAAGSVDEHLDDILTDTAAMQPLIDAAISTRLAVASYTAPDNTTIALLKKVLTNRLELADGDADNWVLYDDDDTTPLLTFSVTDKSGQAISQSASAPSRRTRGS